MKPLIVILCPYPYNSVGSQRFRFEQYLPFLKENFRIVQFSFWSPKSNTILYKKGHFIQKALGLSIGCIKRFFQFFTIAKADAVFIHRETIPIGGAFFEYVISKWLKKKIIYDFDDAIWNLDSSFENKNVSWLKKPGKTKKIITYSSSIIAGNNYLASYAKQYNKSVIIIPTTINLDYHKKIKLKQKKISIGWTGSKTTIQHFELILPVLKKINNKFKDLVEFRVVGDGNYFNKELGIQGEPWSLDTEISELNKIDIGIMPLPNDEWSKGKCGFKGLQYMSLAIPTIMSPVGVNKEIIQDEINGYLANSDNDWIEKISILIESSELRKKIGEKGKETIIDKYSVEANKQKYLDAFTRLLS